MTLPFACRLQPAPPQFYEVVDALEEIPCMQNEHTRSQVVDELRFAGMIRYFASRRAHVTSILRTCLDFEDGVLQSNKEPGDSVPLKRLLMLLNGGGSNGFHLLSERLASGGSGHCEAR